MCGSPDNPISGDPDKVFVGGCEKSGVKLHNSLGGFTGAVKDADGILAGDCGTVQGGSKSPSVLPYTLAIKNGVDNIWRDEDLTFVTDEDGGTIIIDNV